MACNGSKIFFALGLVKLIHLGGNDGVGDLTLVEKIHHHFVVARQSHAGIDQLQHKAQKIHVGIVGKVAVGQHAPFFLVCRVAGCKAVAGQVDKKQLFIYVVEVDRDGLAGRRGNARQRFSAKQGVEQGALAYVGAAGKSDLRNGIGGELLGKSRADLQLCVLCYKSHYFTSVNDVAGVRLVPVATGM